MFGRFRIFSSLSSRRWCLINLQLVCPKSWATLACSALFPVRIQPVLLHRNSIGNPSKQNGRPMFSGKTNGWDESEEMYVRESSAIKFQCEPLVQKASGNCFNLDSLCSQVGASWLFAHLFSRWLLFVFIWLSSFSSAFFFSFLGPEPAFSAWKTNWLPEMKQAELYPQHNQNPTAGKKNECARMMMASNFRVEHPHVGVCMFHIQHEWSPGRSPFLGGPHKQSLSTSSKGRNVSKCGNSQSQA